MSNSPSNSSNSPPVLFTEQPNQHGGKIGYATLIAERTLNALSLPMVELLDSQLRRWADDPELIMVVLQSAGSRAFCAGGDVVELYHSMVAHPTAPNPYAEQFFTREYQLDYLLHRYPKPLLCWGNGIVMGGGLGLMVGCSHRIVTPDSRLAMPEIRIGLYPDVGATWFLGRMPPGIGLFLGLTGASINASDAVLLGLADHLLDSDSQMSVEQLLQATQWSRNSAGNRQRLSELLAAVAEMQPAQPPKSMIETHQRAILAATEAGDLTTVVEAILAIPASDPWLTAAISNLREGSMISALLVWHQLHNQQALSLAEVFRQELVLSLQCAYQREFTEGVRARLIERDQQPRWRYRSIHELPKELIETFIYPPWLNTEHPLANLGK